MGDASLRVFVSQLPYTTTDEELRAHMVQAGRVTHIQLMKNRIGRPSGAGIVTFSSAAEAQGAKTKLNDTDLGGRKIVVRDDRDALLLSQGTRSVFVRNLPWSVTNDRLAEFFQAVGPVESAEVYTLGKRSAGMGIVMFKNPADAQRAIDSHNNADFDGRPISVRVDRGPREPGAPRPTRPMGGRGMGGGRGVGGGRGGGRGAAAAAAPSPPPKRRGGARRVVVSGFAAATTPAELRKAADAGGEVADVKMVKDQYVIDYTTAAHAAEALRKLNGMVVGGRTLRAVAGSEESAAPAPRAPRVRAAAAEPPVLDSAAVMRVFVTNLPYTTAEPALRAYMASAGKVMGVNLIALRNGRPAGTAVVTFDTAEHAKQAVDTLNDTTFEGRPIGVRADRMPLKA